MPNAYRPQQTDITTYLRSVSQATTPEAKIAVLMQALTHVANSANAEFQNVGKAMNAVSGTNGKVRTVTTASGPLNFLSSTDNTVLGDTTANVITLYLPLTTNYPGLMLTVKRKAGGNTLTLAALGSDTVDGGASVTVTTAVTYQADAGTKTWRLVG